jgi:hypothetical protein
LKLIIQNITHLNELNQQLECQYLRFTDDMSMTMHNHSLSSHLPKDDDHSTSLTTANGHDEISEIDSLSFNDEHREEIDELQQEEGQSENYDQLLADIIETLTNQSKKIYEYFSHFFFRYI